MRSPFTTATGSPTQSNEQRHDRLHKQSDSPTQTYGSYLGGPNDDFGRGVTLSGAGTANERIIATGGAASGFPVVSPIPGTNCGRSGGDVFVSVIDKSAPTPGLTYSSCFGGSFDDRAEDVIAWGPSGAESVAVVGPTSSEDFPTDSGSPDPDLPAYQPFAAVHSGGANQDSGFVTVVDLAPTATTGTYIAFASNRQPVPPGLPDSTYLASSAIWKMDNNGGGLTNVTPLWGDDYSHPSIGQPGLRIGNDDQPAISPNGQRILYVSDRNLEQTRDLYVVSKDGPATYACRVTNDSWDERRPAWAPDGATIAFSSNGLRATSANREIHVAQLRQDEVGCATGSWAATEQEATSAYPMVADAPTYSPDSGCIAYMAGSVSGPAWLSADLYLGLNPYSSQCIYQAQPLTTDGRFNSYPAWSNPTQGYPRGRIAFGSGRIDAVGGETESPDDVRLWTLDVAAITLPPATPVAPPETAFIRLTNFTGPFTGASSPAWSPDATSLMAYGTNYDAGDYDIFVIDPANPPGTINLIEDPTKGNYGVEVTTLDWWPTYGPGDP